MEVRSPLSRCAWWWNGESPFSGETLVLPFLSLDLRFPLLFFEPFDRSLCGRRRTLPEDERPGLVGGLVFEVEVGASLSFWVWEVAVGVKRNDTKTEEGEWPQVEVEDSYAVDLTGTWAGADSVWGDVWAGEVARANSGGAGAGGAAVGW